MLVSGRFYSMPKILQEAKSAVLPVPEKAANSQVIGPQCGTIQEPLEGSFSQQGLKRFLDLKFLKITISLNQYQK